ncbi:MAG: hypothetical protein RJA99_1867 [Pseudomonadota bacterium]|jgi:hypothetical protein
MTPMLVPAALVAAGLALAARFGGADRAARPGEAAPASSEDLVARLVVLLRDTPTEARLLDIGLGLVVGGLTLLAVLWLGRSRDGGPARTPSDRGLVYLIGTAAWIAHAIAWAGWCIASLDGIGAFRAVAPEAPLELLFAAVGAGTMLGVVTAPLPCAAFALLAWGRATPAPMWAPPRDTRGWVATAAAAVAIALLGLHAASACVFGAVALVPPVVALGWTALAVRAVACGGAPVRATAGEAAPAALA